MQESYRNVKSFEYSLKWKRIGKLCVTWDSIWLYIRPIYRSSVWILYANRSLKSQDMSDGLILQLLVGVLVLSSWSYVSLTTSSSLATHNLSNSLNCILVSTQMHPGAVERTFLIHSCYSSHYLQISDWVYIFVDLILSSFLFVRAQYLIEQHCMLLVWSSSDTWPYDDIIERQECNTDSFICYHSDVHPSNGLLGVRFRSRWCVCAIANCSGQPRDWRQLWHCGANMMLASAGWSLAYCVSRILPLLHAAAADMPCSRPTCCG